MRIRKCWFGVIALLIVIAGSSASADQFEYGPSGDSHNLLGSVFAGWNIKGAKVHTPGVKVAFFGYAHGCGEEIANGPVSNNGSRVTNALLLTGVEYSKSLGASWSPSGDSELCEIQVRNEVADSFVHINRDARSSGIGLFTYAEVGRGFWSPFKKSGKGGKGINANIEGTFVTFTFDADSHPVRPWADVVPGGDVKVAEFRTTQSVAGYRVGDNSVDVEKAIQAKQQLVLTFANSNCLHGSEAHLSCRFKYMLNTAVYRYGISDWDSVGWFKHADVFFDPAQEGLAILHGPISRSGTTVNFRHSDVGLYSSLGEASQHGEFRDKTFRVQVTFSQFTNALRAVVAKSYGKDISQVTDEDIGLKFGRRWNEPEVWQLLKLAVAQEVVNPMNRGAAYIGGGVKEIYVGPATRDASLGK